MRFSQSYGAIRQITPLSLRRPPTRRDSESDIEPGSDKLSAVTFRNRYAGNVPIVAWLLMTFTDPALAVANDKRFEIFRISKAPTIDGRIDPDEWAGASRITEMHEVEPKEFSAPSDPTEWYFAYDDTSLYVAAYAYDEDASAIAASILRQGASINSDDSMTVIVDPFNNKRSGYSFKLNPNGVREDGIYTTGTQLSEEWDGIWRGNAQIVEDGWMMEMAIPFNTLTFSPENSTWGINVWRRIARRSERVAWYSRNGKVDPTVSGEVSGLSGIHQGIGLDIAPSLTSSHSREWGPDMPKTDVEPSLDVTYKIAPSVNGVLTINTDFAATEVDSRQLDLQRFSLFFPEKRAFFLTDFDVFQFGGVPSGESNLIGMRSGPNGLAFFSRRIGLTGDRAPVDIIAGTKVSGRIGNVDLGTLYVRQDGYATSDALPVDPSDLIVARLSAGVLAESSVGVIITDGNPESNLDSSLAGVDFIYRNTRLGTNRSAEGRFWVQKSDNQGVYGEDVAWSGTLSFPSPLGWEAGVQIQEIGKNFYPALGFASRTGVRLIGGEAAYRHLVTKESLLRQTSTIFGYSRWEYLDTGLLQSEEATIEYWLRSHSGDWLGFDYTAYKEGLLPGEQPLGSIGIQIPPGEHSFGRWALTLYTGGYRKLSVSAGLSDGGYFDGSLRSLWSEFEWRPSKYLAFGLEYSIDSYSFDNNQRATTRQIEFRNDISFNEKLSLVTLAQFDNVSDDMGVNLRLRYNLAAGKDVWIVASHNMARDETDGGRFRNRQSFAAAKVRYTFRF